MAVDPAGQAVPFAQQRLVGDLDGRLPVTGSRSNDSSRWRTEGAEDRREHDRIEVEVGQVGERQPPSRVDRPAPSRTSRRKTCIAARCSSGLSAA